MPDNKIAFLFVLLIVFGINNLFSQENTWRALPVRSVEEYNAGLPGGEGEQHPHSIARCLNHPEYIYLSHDVGGSWRSTDNGDTWQKNQDKGLFLPFGQSIEVDPNNPDIVFIIVDPSYNYKAEGYQGIYRSEDGGQSWAHVLYTQTNIERKYRHNIAYKQAGLGEGPATTWYAALMDNGLYRSDDGGLSWSEEPLSSLEGHETVYEVKTHPTDANIVYVCSSLGLFVSNNMGEGLTKVDALPENISSIAINPQHPDSIYATAYKEGLYLSIDGGKTFNSIYSHSCVRLHMNPGFPNLLYLIGSSRNSKVSSDGGINWEDIAVTETFPGLGRETGWRRWIDGDLSGVVPNPQDMNEAVAFSRSTLFKTTNGGTGFNESATGWTGNAWSWTDNSMAFDYLNPNRFAFFCNDVGTRITTSAGAWFHEGTNKEAGQWYPSKIGWYGTYSGDFMPVEGSETMIASIGNYFKTQLIRTEDLGQSWELMTEGTDNEEMNLFIAYHSKDPSVVYAGSRYSVDSGRTFQKFPFPDGYNKPYAIGMCRAYPDIIYALDYDCEVILRSCDRGQTWEEYARPGWRFKFFDPLPTFAADPVDPTKVYTLDASHDLACYDGESWTSFNVLDNSDDTVSFNYVRNVAVDPNNPSVIYAGMFASGVPAVFRTTDSGENWEDISNNLSRIGGTLKVNPHTGELYRGSIFGTWIFPAPYDEVPEIDPELLTGIAIETETDTLNPGDKITLVANDQTGCYDASQINWASADESIASINQAGELTAIAPGSCIITASTPDGKYLDELVITVINPDNVMESIGAGFELLNYKDKIEIRLPVNEQIESVKMYNILGSLVYEAPDNSGYIDISSLKTGVYFIRVHTNRKIYFGKVLKGK